MRILIGADLVPTENNFDLFTEGNIEALIGKKLMAEFENADLKVFNLELALADKDTPIKKAGPNLRAPTSTVNGIKEMANVIGVSNNHVLDHGYEGFVSTLKTLDDAGIAHVGAGHTKEEAKKPYYFEKDGIKVGVYACCEHEFSWVEDYGFGSNGFDALESLDDIEEAKKNCDYLIVLYHGGKEHYAYPSPYLAKVCRKIIKSGADIVLCQHTHCVGTEEDYMGGKIIFGQGNFIFAKNLANAKTWGPGFLVAIDLDKSGAKYQYIPYVRTENGIEYEEEGEILKGLKERSEEIKQPGFIQEKFEELVSDASEFYVRFMQGRIPEEKDFERITTFHFAECEVHREGLLCALRQRMGLGKFGEFKDLKK